MQHKGEGLHVELAGAIDGVSCAAIDGHADKKRALGAMKHNENEENERKVGG